MLKFDIEKDFEETLLLVDDERYSYKLYKCIDRDSNAFLVKIWEKIVDESIKEIWLQELRQLIFLKNSPNAEKYLLIIDDAKEYVDCFVTTYKIKIEEISYEYYCKNINKNWNSIGNLREKEERIKKWNNLKNIAEGIRLLHENGFLHRNINEKSIVVDVSENNVENFKLTGFEWMLELGRFNFNENANNSIIQSSFHNDWLDYIELARKIFNFEKIAIDNDVLFKYEEFFFYKYENQKLVKYENLIKDIEEILLKLEVQQNNGKEYYLQVLNYNEDDILDKLNNLVGCLDHENMIDFIVNDINCLNKVGILKALHYKQGTEKYFIQGQKILYNIEKSKNIIGNFTTERMVIIDVYKEIPFYAKHDKEFKEFDIVVEVSREKNKKIDWKIILKKFKNKNYLENNVKNFINSILISQAIDIADYYSQIYSVEIVNILPKKGKIKIKLTSDYESESINNALCKKPVTVSFHKFFKDNPDVEWIISNVRPETKNSFYSINNFEEKSDFRFRLFSNGFTNNYEYYLESKIDSENPETIDKISDYLNKYMFLYPKTLLGNYTSLLRKNKAITALAKNTNLMNSLIFPKKNTKVYSTGIDYVAGYKELDKSKRDVFEKTLNTYPNYVVQGPPGVGKTFLVKTIVEQIFKNEAFSKIVLSAQSHSTVEVLSSEIDKCDFENKLVKVKAFNNSNQDQKKIISDTIAENLTKLYGSELWGNSYKNYPDLKVDMDKFKNNKENYNIYNKILSSANIILTTTNSKTIEKMIDNNCYFDWSIMEEAGKASTNDLISPLLLSYKRLLIGDHKQLPPFFEKDFKKIMAIDNLNLDKILFFITKGRFKNNIVYETGLHNFLEIYCDLKAAISTEVEDQEFEENKKELIDIVENKYLPLVNNTLEYYSLFKYLYKEVEINEGNKSKINFGSMISEQYRMHPDISRVINEIFYNFKLSDNDEKKEYYENDENRPFYFDKLNDLDLDKSKRFTWLDIREPFDDTGPIKSLEKNFINETEVRVIETILNSVNKKENFEKKPSIILLSPYAKQVNYINESLSINGGQSKT